MGGEKEGGRKEGWRKEGGRKEGGRGKGGRVVVVSFRFYTIYEQALSCYVA